MVEVAFLVLAVLVIVSAVAVVSFQNTIHSALALIANLLGVAGLFATLEAHFLAAVQIVVYAGAIMVLVLFLLMLLNLKLENPRKFGIGLILTAIVTANIFLLVLLPMINEAFRVFGDPSDPVIGSTKAIGELLYTKYVFTFEIASVLILAALVGAVMVAKRQYRTALKEGRP